MKEHRIYLVGAGPGDPGLITLRAMQAIKDADVVLYDQRVHPLYLHLAYEKAILVYCGKTEDHGAMDQEDMLWEMKRWAELGKNVVRLKGGDPTVFDRIGEEMDFLADHELDYVVVPGLTSASTAALYAGTSVTQQGIAEKLFLCTTQGELDKLAEEDFVSHLNGGTVTVYMGLAELPRLLTLLSEQGISPEIPIAIIQWGTWGRQRKVVSTLAEIATKVMEAGLQDPTMILIGEVAHKGESPGWFEKLTHFGEVALYITDDRIEYGVLAGESFAGMDVYPFYLGNARDGRFDEVDTRVMTEWDFTHLIFKKPELEGFFKQECSRLGIPFNCEKLEKRVVDDYIKPGEL